MDPSNCRIHIPTGKVVHISVPKLLTFCPPTFRRTVAKKVSTDDLKFLIQTYLSEGNNVNKILARIGTSTASKLQTLTTELNIKPTTCRGEDTVTLSRISQSFPELTAAILDESPDIHKMINLEAIRLEIGHPDFPSIAREPSLACLLPEQHPESLKILNVFLLCNMMISEALNKTSEKWKRQSKLQRAEDVKYFQKNYFKSYLFGSIDRQKLCNNFKIMVNDDYSVVWKTAAEKCKAKLEASYGTSF